MQGYATISFFFVLLYLIMQGATAGIFTQFSKSLLIIKSDFEKKLLSYWNLNPEIIADTDVSNQRNTKLSYRGIKLKYKFNFSCHWRFKSVGYLVILPIFFLLFFILSSQSYILIHSL